MRILSLVTTDDSKFYRQQVAGLRKRGHVVETLSVPGTRVEHGAEVGGRSPWAYARHFLDSMAAARRDYDLVHANYGLTAPAAVVQPFHPVVVTFWGSDLMGEFGWVAEVCARFADEVVVMSEEMAARLDGAPHVVPHGVDLSKFRPRPQSEARADLGWDDDAHQVLFPYGPNRPVKDFPRAERVVESARERLDAPVELRTMTGVPHDRVSDHMNAADALLLTSKREGSPNTVKEALACNLPVVATDVGDVAERLAGVAHSAVGETDAELADALVAALRADERSDGRAAISDLSVENQVAQLEAVYRSALREETPHRDGPSEEATQP